MKICLFFVCFSCLGARYYFYKAPEDKPVMYFDGNEWRPVKPGRNSTLGFRKPTLLFDMFQTTSKSPIHNNLSQSIIDGIYRHTTHETNQKQSEQNTTKNTTSNPTIGGTEYIKLMFELSKTLKDMAVKENASYHKQNIPISKQTTMQDFSVSTKHRRNMEGLEDLIDMLTDGIEIDNGSDSSDELRRSNDEFIRKIILQRTVDKAKLEKEINGKEDALAVGGSSDIISDGEAQRRYILVKNKENKEDLSLEEHELMTYNSDLSF